MSASSTTSKPCFELTSSVLSTASKQCFEQPTTSILVCILIFIEYKIQDVSDFSNRHLSTFYYATISQSRSVRCETNKPPAIRVRVEGYTKKNSKRDTIKMFKPIVKRKEENMAQKAHSLSHTKWHCSITLCPPLSIDEKSSIINIEVV